MCCLFPATTPHPHSHQPIPQITLTGIEGAALLCVSQHAPLGGVVAPQAKDDNRDDARALHEFGKKTRQAGCVGGRCGAALCRARGQRKGWRQHQQAQGMVKPREVLTGSVPGRHNANARRAQ